MRKKSRRGKVCSACVLRRFAKAPALSSALLWFPLLCPLCWTLCCRTSLLHSKKKHLAMEIAWRASAYECEAEWSEEASSSSRLLSTELDSFLILATASRHCACSSGSWGWCDAISSNSFGSSEMRVTSSHPDKLSSLRGKPSIKKIPLKPLASIFFNNSRNVMRTGTICPAFPKRFKSSLDKNRFHCLLLLLAKRQEAC